MKKIRKTILLLNARQRRIVTFELVSAQINLIKQIIETTANGSLKIIYSNTKKYQNLKYKNYRLKWAGDDAMITIGTFVNTETKKNMVIKMMNIKKGVAWWVIFAECIGGNPELDRMAGLVIQSIHILK